MPGERRLKTVDGQVKEVEVQLDPRSVLFITEAGDSSSSWARAHVPGKGLAKKQWQVCLTHMQFAHPNGLIAGAAPAKDGKGLGALPITKHIVMRRMNDINGKLAQMKGDIIKARNAGQRVYIDLDDDPWNVPEWNPAHGNLTDKEMHRWEQDMKECDGILVTTPALGLSVADHVGSVPVYVCPNGVDVESYVPNREWPHDPFRLGWIGTLDYRGHDLREIAVGPLREALDGLFGQVEFHHYGADLKKGSIHDLLGPRFPVQVREFPWVPMTKVPEILPQLDAAIIPQVKHPFNSARSAHTGLQMCAAGVPFVASATEPYLELWRQGGGYGISNDPGTWAQSIRMLVSEETRAAATDIRTAGLMLAQVYKPERIAVEWEKAFADGR